MGQRLPTLPLHSAHQILPIDPVADSHTQNVISQVRLKKALECLTVRPVGCLVCKFILNRFKNIINYSSIPNHRVEKMGNEVLVEEECGPSRMTINSLVNEIKALSSHKMQLFFETLFNRIPEQGRSSISAILAAQMDYPNVAAPRSDSEIQNGLRSISRVQPSNLRSTSTTTQYIRPQPRLNIAESLITRIERDILSELERQVLREIDNAIDNASTSRSSSQEFEQQRGGDTDAGVVDPRTRMRIENDS